MPSGSGGKTRTRSLQKLPITDHSRLERDPKSLQLWSVSPHVSMFGGGVHTHVK